MIYVRLLTIICASILQDDDQGEAKVWPWVCATGMLPDEAIFRPIFATGLKVVNFPKPSWPTFQYCFTTDKTF